MWEVSKSGLGREARALAGHERRAAWNALVPPPDEKGAARREDEVEPEAPAANRAREGEVELGWVVVGRLDAPDQAAVRVARERLLARVSATFAGFTWRMPLVERTDLPTPLREEPVEMLQLGLEERDERRWDYVVVVTGSDLIAHLKPFALGVPSRALGVAVLSTARIDPRAQGVESAPEQREQALARRIEALVFHLFGHLAGLQQRRGAMRSIEDIEQLDHLGDFDAEAVEAMGDELQEVADLRVEESSPATPRVRFYARAIWVNLAAIASAVAQARPWLFPARLSKLTTAAVSTLLVLINTAEVWEVALSLPGASLAGLSLVTLGGTSWYIVGRQRLLVRRKSRRLTEQVVATNVSLSVIVALGMLTTYAAIFALTAAAGSLFYADRVVANWSGMDASAVGALQLGGLAAFVASLGIVIGALGASFEQQHYFRHMVYVDEEV